MINKQDLKNLVDEILGSSEYSISDVNSVEDLNFFNTKYQESKTYSATVVHSKKEESDNTYLQSAIDWSRYIDNYDENNQDDQDTVDVIKFNAGITTNTVYDADKHPSDTILTQFHSYDISEDLNEEEREALNIIDTNLTWETVRVHESEKTFTYFQEIPDEETLTYLEENDVLPDMTNKTTVYNAEKHGIPDEEAGGMERISKTISESGQFSQEGNTTILLVAAIATYYEDIVNDLETRLAEVENSIGGSEGGP